MLLENCSKTEGDAFILVPYSSPVSTACNPSLRSADAEEENKVKMLDPLEEGECRPHVTAAGAVLTLASAMQLLNKSVFSCEKRILKRS